MSINFTPLKYNNNLASNKFNPEYISNTSPNNEQTPINIFNHYSTLSDISALKENNNNNNFNTSNFNTSIKNIDLNNNELINSFKNSNINNINENNSINYSENNLNNK